MNQFEIQFAWFFGQTTSLDYEQFAIEIRQKTKRPFVSPATFLPLPPSAPPEIPRVQLQTPDNPLERNIIRPLGLVEIPSIKENNNNGR